MKAVEPKRIGANAELQASQQKEEKKQKRSDIPSSHKPGRYIILLIALIVLVKNGEELIRKSNILEKIAPFIEISGVDIVNSDLLDSTLIADMAAVDSGMTLLTASLSDVRERVASLGGVESVKARLTFDKRIKVTIREREPIAFVILDGTLFFTDTAGVIWPFITGDYWEMPAISGVEDTITDEGERRLRDHDYKRFISLYNLFEINKKSSGNKIVFLDFSAHDMVSMQFNGIKPTIRVGLEMEPYVVKNIEAITELLKKSDVKAVNYIDLSYRNVAFIR